MVCGIIDDGSRRFLFERVRGRRDVVPVALRAAAGAALSLLHGRRFGRAVPRRARLGRRGGRGHAAIAIRFRWSLPRSLSSPVFPPCSSRSAPVRVRSARFCAAYQDVLAKIAGVVIILMGLNFLGVFRIGLFSREARFQTRGAPANPLAAYVMGLAFAFGWTPCIGPVLGPILTLAGARDSVGEGAALLAVYSAGLGTSVSCSPRCFPAPSCASRRRSAAISERVEKAIGVLLVVAGLLFLTGGMQSMSFWLLEQFPTLGTLG